MEVIQVGGDENNLSRVEAVTENHLILQKIMESLSVKDLKSCRLACRFWYAESHFKSWSEKSIVRIGSPQSSRSLANFLNFYSETTANPGISLFAKNAFEFFSLEGWHYNRRDELLYQTFVEKFAENIKLLRLVDLRMSRRDERLCEIIRSLIANATTLQVVQRRVPRTGLRAQYLDKLFQQSSVSFPFLKRLELQLTVETDFSMLFKFPNLKELKIVAPTMTQVDDLFSVMLEYRKTKNINSQDSALALEHLDIIEVGVSPSSLVENDLPLNHLALYICDFFEQPLYNRVLEHYADRLETLKLLRKPTMRIYYNFDFPWTATFANLKELELWGNMTGNWTFLKFTPSLVKLTIDLHCRVRGHVPPDRFEVVLPQLIGNLAHHSNNLRNDFSLETMKELEIDFKLCHLDSYRILKQWMPNLEVLNAPLDSSGVAVVRDLWKDLRLPYGNRS